MNVWWIIGVAVLGFLDALYIYVKKKRNEKLVCVIGSDCNTVIRSRYAVLFGVDNTVIGMIYYVTVILVLVLAPYLTLSSVVVWWGLRLVAGFAALMSVYLLYIQLVVLKEWCDYCLLAALVNIVLAVLLFVL